MKKKPFLWTLILLIVLIAVTFALQTLFREQTNLFELSAGVYLLSVFCLFAYQNALKPTEDFGPRNPTKSHYEKHGYLPKYQCICKILLIVTFAVGTLNFFGGLGEVIFHYVKALISG